MLQVVGQKGKGVAMEVGQPSSMHKAEKEATPLDIMADLLLDLLEYVPPLPIWSMVMLLTARYYFLC
jgi:hypothetical protein